MAAPAPRRSTDEREPEPIRLPAVKARDAALREYLATNHIWDEATGQWWEPGPDDLPEDSTPDDD